MVQKVATDEAKAVNTVGPVGKKSFSFGGPFSLDFYSFVIISLYVVTV